MVQLKTAKSQFVLQIHSKDYNRYTIDITQLSLVIISTYTFVFFLYWGVKVKMEVEK